MKKIKITFQQFCEDFRDYYKCKNISIRTESEAENVIWDLYETEDFEFDYENKVIEIS